MFKLLTTTNCSNCNKTKNMIKALELKIEVEEASEEIKDKLIEKGVMAFPVLIDSEFNVISSGANAGYYIAENNSKFV